MNKETQGKTYARVVFLLSQNLDSGQWEALAFFPDIKWDNYSKNHLSYMANGGFAPCCDSYIHIDCRIPNLKNNQQRNAVNRLKEDIEKQGYELTVLDTAEWLNSQADKAKRIQRTVLEISKDIGNFVMSEHNRGIA